MRHLHNESLMNATTRPPPERALTSKGVRCPAISASMSTSAPAAIDRLTFALKTAGNCFTSVNNAPSTGCRNPASVIRDGKRPSR